jgi:hypothetical protein
MIWGAKDATDANFARVKNHGDTLLGFNEPDHPGQSNMTVDAALQIWPKLMATGMRLGSPAAAQDPSKAGSWLEGFMNGAQAKGYRVDFIAVHWYGCTNDVDIALYQLRSFLDRIHAKYGRPIWLTEYALTTYGGYPLLPASALQAEFARRSAAMLESLSYVERYAWFSVPPHEEDPLGHQRSLYLENGSPTAIGTAYRDALLSVAAPETTKIITNGQNLLANAGFEASATGWSSYSPLKVASGDAHSGIHYLAVAAGGIIWQGVGRLPAGLYRASVWVRGRGMQKAVGLSLAGAHNWHSLTGSWDVVPDGAWKQIAVTARINGTGEQSGLHVEFYKFAKDTAIPDVQLDDFELVRLSD